MMNADRLTKLNSRRVLHVQMAWSIDQYITFDTPEEATEALINMKTQNPFSRLPKGPQATRLRSLKASLLERIPSGWRADDEKPKSKS